MPTNMPSSAASGDAPDKAGSRGTRALLGASIAASVMLVIEAAIGIVVNLNVNIPAADAGHGFWVALGRALADGPVALGVHTAIGLLLVLTSINVLVRAILSRRGPVITASAVGVLAMVGAAGSGANFVSSGKNAASVSMAVLAGIGLICYLTNVALIRRRPAAVAATR